MGLDWSRIYCGTGMLEGSLGVDDLKLRSSGFDMLLQLDLLIVYLLLI